ncbi:dephospho-CoA kinase [Boudabousia liubingyangii]|uniref:dephospho-CoA kinase n=1 Tax=Boudabousia liubingyangii TaxID=1921764 RepID=UPI00093A1ADF|nr:dephospho-CoA kinase [Boudabousia liubingyangii]
MTCNESYFRYLGQNQEKAQTSTPAGGLSSSQQSHRPLVVGLTGGIGTGKSTFAEALLRQNHQLGRGTSVTHLDADQISRNLTAPNGLALPEIRTEFGQSVFNGTELDRQALAQVIFQDESAKKRLEAILHPLIRQEILTGIQTAKEIEHSVLLDVPLLFEAGLNRICDQIITITAPLELRIERLTERGISQPDAQARIANQISDQERLNGSTWEVHNGGDKRQLSLLAAAFQNLVF